MLVSALAAAASLAVLPSFAEPNGDRSERGLDLAQLEVRAAERFAAMDLDADGLVTATEFAQAPKGRDQRHHGFKNRGKRHQKFDDQAFDTIDADNNGQISREEFDQRRASLHAVRKEGRGERRFDRLDQNGDGALTADELQAKVARLREFDADNNGLLTRQEMRKAKAAMRQSRGEQSSSTEKG